MQLTEKYSITGSVAEPPQPICIIKENSVVGVFPVTSSLLFQFTDACFGALKLDRWGFFNQ